VRVEAAVTFGLLEDAAVVAAVGLAGGHAGRPAVAGREAVFVGVVAAVGMAAAPFVAGRVDERDCGGDAG
jgi:hypothetical protein